MAKLKDYRIAGIPDTNYSYCNEKTGLILAVLNV